MEPCVDLALSLSLPGPDPWRAGAPATPRPGVSAGGAGPGKTTRKTTRPVVMTSYSQKPCCVSRATPLKPPPSQPPWAVRCCDK